MPTKNVAIGQRSLTLDARPDRLDLIGQVLGAIVNPVQPAKVKVERLAD